MLDPVPSVSAGLERVRHIDVHTLLRALFRQRLLIILCMIATLACGVFYVASTPPTYRADADILIDPRRVQVFQKESLLSDVTFDSASMESQVQTLRSERVSIAVIRSLKLTEDPEFVGEGPSQFWKSLVDLGLFESTEPSEDAKLRSVLEKVQRRLEVKRVGLSYVLNLSFTSEDSTKAARIANEFADAFITDNLESKFDVTRRASVWLQQRIEELRRQAADAQRAALDYRLGNNLVDTGQGRTITEQQVAETISQLTVARTASAEAKARLDRIVEVNKSDLPDASVTDALRNEVIIRYRNQYLDASKREADWSARYGPNHSAAVALRNEMRELQRSIRDELNRIAETYRSDFEIAQARETALQATLSRLITADGETRQAQLKLRELESAAQSAQNIYDNFLQRYQVAVQQQSFPISDARVISVAMPPLRKSWPRTSLVLGAALALGGMLGAAIAIGRDLLDRGVRTRRDAQDATGAPTLASLPHVRAFTRRGAVRLTPVARPNPAERICDNGNVNTRLSIEYPYSQFAEGIRAAKVGIDLAKRDRRIVVVGIVSARSGEGKTTVAINLARLIASTGARALLVDSDLRHPDLTRLLAGRSTSGLVDVLAGRAPVDEVMWRDSLTTLHVLPSGQSARLQNTQELVSGEGMQRLLDAASGFYEYVIVDLPPIGPAVDVRASAHLFDALLMVVEWGTSFDQVEHALAVSGDASSRLLGTILNNVNIDTQRYLEPSYGTYYSAGGR